MMTYSHEFSNTVIVLTLSWNLGLLLELIPKHYELQAVDYHLYSTQAKSDFARFSWNQDVWPWVQRILSHFGVYKV